MTSLAGLARLVRASIALSPIADAVVSATLAHVAGVDLRPAILAPAIGCSLALYLFGMALNDRCDAERDAVVRPDRPIPSGAVSRRAATAVCAMTLAIALVCGALAAHDRPLALGLLAGLVVSIVAYDAAPAHLAAFGPPLLGAIRGQNLLFTAAALGAERAALPAAIGYAVWIACIGWIARCEDGAVPPTRGRLGGGIVALIVIAAATAVVVFLRFRPDPPWIAIALAAAGLAIIARRFANVLRATLAVEPLVRAPIPRLVGTTLSTIFLFHATITAAAGSVVVPVALALVDPLARRLARRFPPS